MSQIGEKASYLTHLTHIGYNELNRELNWSGLMRFPEAESSTIEWKREFPRNDQIIKTLIGFCNQNGGKLILGVDNSGRIVGLPDKSIQKGLESLEKAIYQASTPPIIPQVYTQRFGIRTVLIIAVSSGMNKPYYRASEGPVKGTYIRLGRNTVRANREMIEELKWQGRGIDFESLPVYKATRDDLSLPKFQRFLKARRSRAKGEITDALLESYTLITQEHGKTYPTCAGLLLFGRDPQRHFSEAMILCSHFRGIQGRTIIASVDCEGSLTEQFEQAITFISDRLYHSATIKGMKRTEKLEIPEVAIREVLFNAIIHRNYHIKAPAKVAIYTDRIEVFSPGLFPGPLDVKNLTQGITYLRNPAICKIFREQGYVEKLGTGFITLFKSYEKWGLEQPLVIEGDNFVKCILPRRKRKLEAVKSDDASKILNLLDTSDEISLSDVMSALSVSRATASRRLNRLTATNKVKRVGHTRAVRYRRA